jgi:hypothetical protein
MRTVIAFTTCAILCGGLLAQTPANTASTPARSSVQASSSNEDKNIRAYIELLRTDLRKSKSQVMGEVMRLDTDEAQKFWPVYKDFETDYKKIGDQIVSAVTAYAKNYDKMTDAMSDELANQILMIEQERNVLKKKFYDRMKATLGPVTAMRFLQVENQLERLLDLQIAAQLPVDSE